jgi:hypothetical protein
MNENRSHNGQSTQAATFRFIAPSFCIDKRVLALTLLIVIGAALCAVGGQF